MPGTPSQTAGALRTRRYRARRKNGERVFPVRLNREDLEALIVYGFARAYTAADIERGIHSLIATMRHIKLRMRPDRTLEWQR
jgi:hypothetical protein